MADDKFVRRYAKRQHQILGAYCAYLCWLSGVSVAVIPRDVFEGALSLSRVRNARIKWVVEDLRKQFKSVTPLYDSTGARSYSTLYASRRTIDTSGWEEPMSDADRIKLLKDDRVSSLLITVDMCGGKKDKIDRHMIGVLAELSSGIADLDQLRKKLKLARPRSRAKIS